MEAFEASRRFPVEEKYSLTDQIRRSSRSVAANTREGFAKRRYKNVFSKHLVDALGSAEETRTWLDFAFRCGYLQPEAHEKISAKYDRVCAMLYRLHKQWSNMMEHPG